MACYSACLLLLFCLEPTVRKDTSMRTTSVPVMVVFSKVALWKLRDHSSVQSPFSTNTRHIDNSILKDTLQFFVFRAWINMPTKSFIKTSVNVTDTRIDEGVWTKIVTQSVHLEEHCTKIETTFHIFYALLFLTSLVFKFNLALIGFFWKCQPQFIFLSFD